ISKRRPRHLLTRQWSRRAADRWEARYIATSIVLWQLTTETRLDESKRGVVAPPVGSEGALVAFGDDSEATIFFGVNRPLELRCPPWLEHQTAGGHAAA